MNWLKQQVANVAGTQEPIYGPSALKSVAKQAETTPYTILEKEDLKWKAMESTCVETQTFYMTADSGHIGLVQVIYSNVAGLRTTCQFNTMICYPDGKTPKLWSSDALSNYGFDEEKYCFYADGCAVDLSADGTYFTIKSATNTSSLVNIKVIRTAPGIQGGQDGTSYFGTDPQNPWGSMRHRFWPRCEVEGGIITKQGNIDFKGKGMLSHALQGMKPHHAAAKWNFVNFQAPTYSAIMMDFTTPPSYGSSVVNVGAIVKDDQILYAGTTNVASHAETKLDSETGWREPAAVKFQWNGTTKEGKAVSAELSGGLSERLDKVDVMAEVPGFVKTIIGGVSGAKPYIYQYSPNPKPNFKFKINVDGSESEEEGVLFYEATFISE